MDPFEGKKVFLTGCCGTIGSEILNQLQKHKVSRVVCIDNNETNLFFVKQQYKAEKRFKFFLCDIREKDVLRRRTQVQIL